MSKKDEFKREFSPFWDLKYWDNWELAQKQRQESCCVCGKGHDPSKGFEVQLIRGGGAFGPADGDINAFGNRGYYSVCAVCSETYKHVWVKLGYQI